VFLETLKSLHKRMEKALCCGLLAGSAALAQHAPLQSDRSLILQIEEALRAQRYTSALALSFSALKLGSQDPRLWTLQGMAYAGSGKLKSAFASDEHALRIKPDYLPALEGAAQVSYLQNDSEAGTLLQRLLRLHPDDPTTHAMVGVLAARQGDGKEAIIHLAQAQRVIATQPAALARYGVCLSQEDRFDEAITQFQAAQALQPEDRAARYNLALAYWNAKRFDDAYGILQPLIQSGTSNEELLTLAADVDEARNDTPQAVALLHKAIEANPQDPRAYVWFANLASDHSSFQVGIDMLNAGIRILPREGQLYIARGVLYALLGDFEKATSDFEAAHRFNPNLAFAGTAEGIVATQRHDLNGSVVRFRHQVRSHPESAFDHYLLAETLRQRGAEAGTADYAEALREAQTAVKLDPSLAVAREILADLYLSDGKTAMAAAQCEAVLQSDSDNQEALYRLILTLRKSDRKQEVPTLVKRLVALREAQKTKRSHLMRYELVENVERSAAQSIPGTPSNNAH
jgi:tetratricopeptide (TPR) repeat protein